MSDQFALIRSSYLDRMSGKGRVSRAPRELSAALANWKREEPVGPKITAMLSEGGNFADYYLCPLVPSGFEIRRPPAANREKALLFESVPASSRASSANSSTMLRPGAVDPLRAGIWTPAYTAIAVRSRSAK